MIAAVILAAGSARRFGRQKLLAPIAGRSMVRHTVERVLRASVDEVIVVLGADAATVGEALRDLPARIVVNDAHAQGMAISLACGVRAISEGAEGILVTLGDQPTVTTEIIDRLIAAWQRSDRPIVAPVYDGVRGNPVLFDVALRDELLALTGDHGARDVITRDPARVEIVAFPHAPPADVDTPAELEALRVRWSQSS